MSTPDIDQQHIHDFINAIRSNDMVTVIDLVDTGRVKVNTPLDDGLTPLICAVLTGSVDCVEFLVRNGADVSVTTKGGDYDGVSALHYAIPDVAKMRVLLAAGADVNVVDPNGRTILMEYLTRGYVVSEDLVRLLAEYKFNFTTTNTSGCNHLTVLMATANSADPFNSNQFIQSLQALSKHMDLNVDCSTCPIFDLTRMGYNESGDISNLTSLASIGLFLALNAEMTKTGNMSYELVQRLVVECGMDIPQTDATFLLQAAVRADSEEAFVQLVTRGINPFVVNCGGFNIVSACVYYGAQKVLTALTDFASFLDTIAEKEGRPIPRGGLKYSGYSSPEGDPITGNPLFLALIRQSPVEIFQALLKAGFSVNDREVSTLLPMPFALVAAAFGRWDVVEVLMRTHTGTNIVDISSSADDKAMQLLQTMPGAQDLPPAFQKADVRNVLTLALLKNKPEVVSSCLAFGTTVPATIASKPIKEFLRENDAIDALAALEAFENKPKVIDAAFAASQSSGAASIGGVRSFSTFTRIVAPYNSHTTVPQIRASVPAFIYRPRQSNMANTLVNSVRRVLRQLK